MKLEHQNRIKMTQGDLLYHGIKWVESNNGYHFKIGKYNYYPTTEKWNDDKLTVSGLGIASLIANIKNTAQPIDKVLIKQLTVQQIAKIFLKNEGKSLMEKCELLHKEIYG